MRGPDRRIAAAAVALLALAPWIYFWRGATLQVLLGDGDAFVEFLPTWIWAAGRWKALTPPLWCPYLYSGFPLFADPTVAAFHPLQLLFVLLPPLAAFNLVVLFYFGLAGVCTFLLARQEGLTEGASLLAGATYAYCGFLLGHMAITPILLTLASFPTILCALGRARRRPGWGSSWLVALAVVHLVLCGHPQFAFYALVCAAAYTVRLAWPGTGPRPEGRRAFALTAGAAVLLGLGLAAVQLLPTRELMLHSWRQGITYQAFAGDAHPPSALFASLVSSRLLVPVTGGAGAEVRIDVGPLPLLLAAFAVVLVPRRSRFWIGLLVIGALLWMGDTTPLYRWMFHVPGYNLFRIATRNGVMVAFAASMLAAHGLDALERRRDRRLPVRLRGALLVSLPLVYVVGWGLAGGRVVGLLRRATLGGKVSWAEAIGELHLSALVPALAMVAAATFAIALCLWWGGGGRLLAGLCVVLAVGHLWSFGDWLFLAPAGEVAAALAPGAVAPPLRPAGDREAASFRVVYASNEGWIDLWERDRSRWRATYARAGGADVNLVHRVAVIGGYSPLMPRAYTPFAGKLLMWGGISDAVFLRSAALDLLNVRFVAVPDPEHGLPARSYRHLEPVWEGDGVRVYRNPSAAGLVWGVERVEAADDAAKRLRRMPRGAAAAVRTALVAPADAAGLTGRRFAVPSRLSARHLDEDTVAVEVETPGDAFLASSLISFPGWRATVDGERVELVRVNGLFQGLAVPAGRHRVVLRYLPASFLWGLAITALAAAVLVAGTVVDRRGRRRSRDRGPLTPPPPAPAPTAG